MKAGRNVEYEIIDYWMVQINGRRYEFRRFLNKGDLRIQGQKFNNFCDERKSIGLNNRWRVEMADHIRHVFLSMLDNGYKVESAREVFRVIREYFLFFEKINTEENDGTFRKTFYPYFDYLLNKKTNSEYQYRYAKQQVGLLSRICDEKFDIDLKAEFSNKVKLAHEKQVIASTWAVKSCGLIYDFRQFLINGESLTRFDSFYLQSHNSKSRLSNLPSRQLFVRSAIESFQLFTRNCKSIVSIQLYFSSVQYLVYFLESNSIGFESKAISLHYKLIFVQLRRDKELKIISKSIYERRSLYISKILSSYLEIDFNFFKSFYKSLAQETKDYNSDKWIMVINKYKYDLRYLLTKKCLEISHSGFKKLPNDIKNEGLNESYSSLLIKYREMILTRVAMGLKGKTIIGLINLEFRFIRYLHEMSSSLSKKSILSVLSKFSREKVGKAISGNIAAKTSNAYISAAVNLVADFLELEKEHVRAVCAFAPYRDYSGLNESLPVKSELKLFSSMLNIVISKITVEKVKGEKITDFSVNIDQHKLQLIYLKSVASQDSTYSSIPNHIFNKSLIHFRIFFELARFILRTGVNLSVARALVIGDFKGVTNKKLKIFKPRKLSDVEVRITKSHRKQIDQYLVFLKSVLDLEDERAPLFPKIVFGSLNKLISQFQLGINIVPVISELTRLKCFDYIKAEVKKSGLPWFNSPQLRKFKSYFILNETKGDLLAASRVLSNTPQSIFGSYGGKGNLHLACEQISGFFEKEGDGNFMQSIAPGFCISENVGIDESTNHTKCSLDTYCLTCINYRGENSFDYVHKQLSWQQLLIMRTESNSSEELSKAIEIIDGIVNSYVRLNPASSKKIHKLRKDISQGKNLHHIWENKVKIYSLSSF